MKIEHIQDILPLVEQPSRYLGSEVNTVKKDIEQVRLRFALAFPDLYEIGTSHFGLQILYHILNEQNDIAAERVFTPGTDMEEKLRKSGLPLSSLESGTALKHFHIIGFSLLYELDYTNILTILDLAGIPFLASQRDESHPLLIAGGPCTCNPEPVADFFDAIVIGDGENASLEMARAWLDWDGKDRQELLKRWACIEGVYIPSFFEAKFDESGIQTVQPQFQDYTNVYRTILADLDKAPFPDTPLIPFGRPVHDRLRLELARGCTRGCRFCQAGMIYRPVRERSPETLISLSEKAIAATGYEDISLLSLSTGDYSAIESLMRRLMERCASDHIAVSLPSLRAGTLTPELMELIKKVRKTGFTIAPEAGSQRLRDVINKNITQEDIFDTVKDAFDAGWQIIKLYFMIGLPTETMDDLEAVVDLVKELRKIKGPKGRKSKINVSVGTFVPKPHTPFQWSPQISLAESKEKIAWLKDRLRIPGIHFKWQKPEVSFLEGVWSRGDRRLSRLLITAYEKGCRLDGWSDNFRYDLWQEAFEHEGTDIDFYLKNREMDAPLPWNHIDMGLTEKFLKDEWNRAVKGESTPDCRNGECNACGVCDFTTIEPKVFTVNSEQSAVNSTSEALKGRIDTARGSALGLAETGFKTLQVSYSKQGDARYFGHLEMVNIFFRAVRRAGIPVKYSGGFHPMPKVSFNNPLPVGMESMNECFYITVPGHVKVNNISDALNSQLPKGLQIHSCHMAPPKSARNKNDSVSYHIKIKSGILDEKALQTFNDSSEFIFTRINHKGKKKSIDLKRAVSVMDMISPLELEITVKNEQGKAVRPSDVLKEIFKLSDEAVKQAAIVKL